MKLQLLLLLALAGPFCAFPSASPITHLPEFALTETVTPTSTVSFRGNITSENPVSVKPVSESTDAPRVSNSTATDSPTAAEEVTTVTTAEVSTNATEAVAESETPVMTGPPAYATIEQILVTEPEELQTEFPDEKTTAATEHAQIEQAEEEHVEEVPSEAEPEETLVEKTIPETAEELVVEDEGLSSGQVAGIVIGALVAVIIVIAVVIAMVRRMGKYSP